MTALSTRMANVAAILKLRLPVTRRPFNGLLMLHNWNGTELMTRSAKICSLLTLVLGGLWHPLHFCSMCVLYVWHSASYTSHGSKLNVAAVCTLHAHFKIHHDASAGLHWPYSIDGEGGQQRLWPDKQHSYDVYCQAEILSSFTFETHVFG